jgi:hypothetical protein
LDFPFVEGVQRVSPNPLESKILGGWKPTVVVTGLNGIPSTSKAGNVMLPFIEAKLSIRLPPTKNPKDAEKFVLKTLTANPPYNAKVTAKVVGVGSGFNAPNLPSSVEKAIYESS